MTDSLNFNEENKLKPILTMSQLVSCNLVSEAILHIRVARSKSLEKTTKQQIPQLNTSDRVLNKAYMDFAEIIQYKMGLLLVAKRCFDDIEKYNFASDKSINKTSQIDTEHLRFAYNADFAKLENVNLKDHTLRVFDNALAVAKKNGGRSIKVGIPLLAALLHDFGKSVLLREELLGIETGDATRKHALVSKLYVDNILAHEFKSSIDSIDMISMLVEHHHPASKKIQKNEDIQFIMAADKQARDHEIKQVRQEMAQNN